MTPFQLLIILIRAIAVFFTVQGLTSVGVIVDSTIQFAAGPLSLAAAITTILASGFFSLLFGLIVWKIAPKLARVGATFEEEPATRPEIDIRSLHVVLLSTLGVYLVMVYLPQTIQLIANRSLVMAEATRQAGYSIDFAEMAATNTATIGAFLKALCGVALIIGSRKLSSILGTLYEFTKKT
jgi:hypothetical protein